MNNRRNFIKNLGALGLLLGTTKLDLSAQTKSTKSATSTKINKPIETKLKSQRINFTYYIFFQFI